MAITGVGVTTGTGARIAVDSVGTAAYQVVKIMQAGEGDTASLSSLITVTQAGTTPVSIASPMTVTGTSNVAITNTVAISGTASVSVINTAAVTVANTAAVTIANSPTVTLSNSPTVTVSNSPTVTVSNVVGVFATNPASTYFCVAGSFSTTSSVEILTAGANTIYLEFYNVVQSGGTAPPFIQLRSATTGFGYAGIYSDFAPTSPAILNSGEAFTVLLAATNGTIYYTAKGYRKA